MLTVSGKYLVVAVLWYSEFHHVSVIRWLSSGRLFWVYVGNYHELDLSVFIIIYRIINSAHFIYYQIYYTNKHTHIYSFIEGVIIIKRIDCVFKVKIWGEFRFDHSSVHQCCNHNRIPHCKFVMLAPLMYWVYIELPDTGTRLTTQRQRRPNNKTWRRTAEPNIWTFILL